MSTLETGQYIKHAQYGCGVIVKRDSERTTIDFDSHGPKLFVTSLMSVELAEGVPPKRRRAKRVKAEKPAPVLASRIFVPGSR